MISYARSTYQKSREFNEKLKELQKTIKPAVIRTYLAMENRHTDPFTELDLGLSDEDKAGIDELKALRMAGIQGEIRYALAQANKNGIQLSEEIVSGRSIVPGFSREFLEKVPSLGVYQLFMLFTEEEFQQWN